MQNGQSIILAGLARNQNEFFLGIAPGLRKLGYEVIFLSFHERTVAEITSRGFTVFNLPEHVRQFAEAGWMKVEELETLYGISNIAATLRHEKFCYEIHDTKKLIRKFLGHTSVLERIFEKVRGRGATRIALFQELGGFLSVMATYFVARRHAIDSVFMEPSFFRGRVLFTRNSFRAPRVSVPPNIELLNETSEYLKSCLAEKKIVIPTKDRVHYRGAAAKVFSSYNAKRAIQKLIDKHILGYEEEFQHTSLVVRNHLKMLAKGALLSRRYAALPQPERFIYYPLHVPADFALTVRSPEYMDQFTLLDYLAKITPITHKLVFKEHPALVGAVNYSRVRDVLKKNDNAILLNPKLNNFDVIRAADAIVTINSKSGAEAILLGKPCIVLGDAFYAGSDLVYNVSSLAGLESALLEALAAGSKADRQNVSAFFQAVWNLSFRGELFDCKESNLATFTKSMDEFLRC